MIDSPEIASQVAKIMDEGVSPGSAYHVTLDKDDRLVWTAETNGEKVQYDKDPGTNVWERLLFDFIGILPICTTCCRARGRSKAPLYSHQPRRREISRAPTRLPME